MIKLLLKNSIIKRNLTFQNLIVNITLPLLYQTAVLTIANRSTLC